MDFAYDIFPAERAIVARYGGCFTLVDLKESARRLWSDPRYARDFDGIVDLTDSSVGVAIADFRALLDFICAHPNTSRGRWAAVACSPLATACSLIYQRALAHRHVLGVFSTQAAACAFVGFELGDGPMLGGINRPRRG